MTPDKTPDKIRPTFTFTEDRLAELRAVVPEAFPDGELDWDTLREALGASLPDGDAPAEHFGLNWPGKREARRLAAKPSHGALHPAPGEGVAEETTRNLYLEGDNLEVLKLLQKSYAGRVKMIFIDPPYNTGNDFVYKDDFSEPLADYLRRSGQVGEKGELLTSNPKSSGRFHTNWLNMMYPRLRLARTLLREDGVIFVSIDDNEVHNLRAVMNELFGEEGFVEEIVWKNKYGSGAMTTGFANVHEYILCYSKTALESIEAPLDEESISQYTKIDAKFPTRGGYITQPLATNSKDPRPNLRYAIHHQGVEIWPEKQWVWSKDRLMTAYANDEVVINEKDGKYSVRVKQYLKEKKGNIRKGKPISIFNGPFNQDGTKETKELLGEGIFSFPKPSALVKKLLSFSINGSDGKDDIILDFFAGSATTAQAILQLNHEDGGNRRFILTQIPEPTPFDSSARKAGFNTLAEIGKERIRRVITQISNAKRLDMRQTREDLGFKVYKLGPSSFKAWKDYEGDDLTALQNLFDEFKSPLVPDWTPGDLLAEVLLLEGFPLDSTVEPQPQFTRNAVVRVASPASGHCLWTCFDAVIQPETLDALALPPGDVFVCLDAALGDDTKVRLTQAGSLKTI